MKFVARSSRRVSRRSAWPTLLSSLCSSLGFWGTFAAITAAPSPAQAKILWSGDFENSNLTEFMGSISAMTGTRKNIEFVTDTVQNGKVAAKITIHPDDLFEPYSQSRVEVKHTGVPSAEGQDTYLSWYFQMQADAGIRDNIAYFESNSSFLNTMTFFVAPKAGGGTTLTFGTGNLGSTKRWSTDLVLKQWHQIALHVKWSRAATGVVEVWYDGAKVVDVKGANKRDNNTLFFQTGLHRGDPAKFVDTIFIDNFVEADSVAEILAKPAGDGGVATDGGASDAGTSADTSGAGGTTGTGGGGGSGSSSGGSTGASGGSTGSAGNTAGVVGTGGDSAGGASGQASGSSTGSGGASTDSTGSGGSRRSTSKPSGGCAVAVGGVGSQGAALPFALLGLMLGLRRRARRRS